MIDDLKYDYKDNGHSNILLKVSEDPNGNPALGFIDGSNTNNDYEYDEFGNMLLDRNKGITSIEYNHLNLPRRINFASGGNIIYIYNAQGVKLQKTVNNPNSTQASTRYRGGFQYDNNTLQFVHTAEGYIKHTINPFSTNPTIGAYHDFDYVYNYTDHLGNIRLSYTLDPATQEIKVMEENHYYPFGLKHTYNLDRRDIGYFDHLLAGTLDPNQDTRRTRMVSNNGYQYKFIGEERQEELGLNWDTFRHRNYDYTIGRFFGVDPITEEYMSISPYQFAHNNPVWKIELEGLEGVETSGQDIVNREPVYMSTSIIISTFNVHSTKPQKSRPGVPMLRMGIGGEVSSSKTVGGGIVTTNGTATAIKANIGLAVCIDGERIEYGLTVGQVSANTNVGGQDLLDGQFTTFSADGSYNMRNGDQQLNIQTFTSEVNMINGEESGENDLIKGLHALGGYIELNFTEMSNNIQDLGSLIMSYLQGLTEDYFNGGNSSGTNINPMN